MTNTPHEVLVTGAVAIKDPDTGVTLNLNNDGSINTALPTNASTETSSNGIYWTLIKYLKAIAKPAWFDPSINRVRETAIIESGTVTAVTTVGNITSIGGYTAQNLLTANTRAAWAVTCRNRIT